jgi:hypothetical protein
MNKRVGVLLAAVFLLVAPSGLIAASFDSLLPLLVDLAGWQAEKAEGIDLGQAGMKGVSVYREYTSGDKGLSAAVLLGSQVGASWMPDYREGFKMETSEGTMEVGMINGFLVYRGFDKGDSSGGIMALLLEAVANKPESGAVFVLTFDGITLEEGLKLAQKFDWKRMKDAAARVK